MQLQKHAGNMTTNYKVIVDFTLQTLVAWKCHLDESAKGRYYIFLGRDLLTELVLNIKCSKHVIEADDGSFIEATATMVDLGA